MNKTTARIIVTYTCHRHCPSCCNTFFTDIPSPSSIKELLTYQEIIITGGEPMLIADKVLQFIQDLKKNGYQGKLYLYTSRLDIHNPMEKELLQSIDGITYTLHNEYLPEDIPFLCNLNQYFCSTPHQQSNRLLIDSRIYQEILPQLNVLTQNGWDSIRELVWKEEGCPVLPNETLYYYSL